jgi:hypothetical protein
VPQRILAEVFFTCGQVGIAAVHVVAKDGTRLVAEDHSPPKRRDLPAGAL